MTAASAAFDTFTTAIPLALVVAFLPMYYVFPRVEVDYDWLSGADGVKRARPRSRERGSRGRGAGRRTGSPDLSRAPRSAIRAVVLGRVVNEIPDDPTRTVARRAGLDRARAASTLLDEAIRVPGTDRRIGLDPILGLLPVAGDAVAALASLYVVFEAFRAGVPGRTLAAMLLLIAVDAVAGSVPVVGPVFDAFWKANRWNVSMFEDHVERTG
jgi:hypothetical protein